MQLQRVPGEPVDPRQDAADRLLEHGVILLTGDLTADDVATTTGRLLTLAHEPDRGVITIHLSGVGGSVGSALAIHDVMTGVAKTIRIVATGLLGTAGAIVLRAGSTGERTLLPAARIHLRRPTEPETDGLELESAAREVEHVRAQAEAVLGLPLHPPRLLTADDAVAAGIADQISLNVK